MDGSTKLFKIFGIDVQLHFSWWLIFVLLAWSLSSAFFPQSFPGLSVKMYWLMGIVASLLLFVSVLLHELSHSLVAKARKIKVESITLFFFGGVAGIDDEDMKAGSEFLMAIAGPLFSLFLALVFFLIYKFNGNVFWAAITMYLYQLNFILAIFNLIPGFPLDGGRAFRAILHAYYHDLKKATKIAASSGRIFAIFLIVLGIFGLLSGAAQGLWLIFLGGFLYFIAGLSYEQVVLKDALSRIKVKELLKAKYPEVSSETYFSDLLKEFANRGEDMFVVEGLKRKGSAMKGKSFIGMLDLKALDKMPPQLQKTVKLKQLATPADKVASVNKEDTAYAAFKSITKQKSDFVAVMDKKKFLGFVTKKVLMNSLIWSLKYGADKENDVVVKNRKKLGTKKNG
ncbi:MAG: site-2 protease family protein [Nanoarchaeota archaeon]